jgi:hypothetical protein
VITKNRVGHKCAYKWMVITTISWDGLSQAEANEAYASLASLGYYGIGKTRACRQNGAVVCACQGDEQKGGASYSFGCSTSVHHTCTVGEYVNFCLVQFLKL